MRISEIRRLAIPALAAMFLMFTGAGSGFAAEEGGLETRVIVGLGDMEKLKAVRSIRITSTSINFGNMTSYAAGAPPIHLSDSQDVTLWEPMPRRHNERRTNKSQRFRIHSRLEALVPFPGGFDFKEAFDGTYATRSGPRDYRAGPGPELAGAYLGARLKRLQLDHPQWLMANASRLTPNGVTTIYGKKYVDLAARVFGEEWYITVDPDSLLPHSVVINEPDERRGTPTARIVTSYGDWRAVDDIMMPFRIEQKIDGVLVRRVIRKEIKLNVEVVDEDFRLADISRLVPPEESGAYKSAAGTNTFQSDVDWGHKNAHWFLGRYAMGRSSETRQKVPVEFRHVGEGIFQVTGTTHHNLVIVGPNSLVVIDAPFYPRRSQEVLAALRQRWPDKPVQYLILTHHHADHMGGMSEYTKGGAQLVVAAGNKATFQRNFDGNGLLGRGDQRREILEVSGRRMLPDFGRDVELLWVPNSHAFHMLVAYFPDEKLLFATDLYSPGRPKQPPNFPGELLNAIEFYGLDVERLIGGHGGGPDSFAQFLEFAE